MTTTTTDDRPATQAWIATVAYLERLSNAELAELLYNEVWATSPLRTRVNDLVAEAITRLREQQG
jgi:hypothetical protein